MTAPLEILYEDNHVLAVNKPPGLLAMGDRSGAVTLVQLAKEYLKQAYHKPGDVFLGVVHRLDRPVSGVMLFARTSKAAARLSAQFREHAIGKMYLAWIDGRLDHAEGTLTHWLLKDRIRNQTRVVPNGTDGALECLLDYRRVRTVGTKTLLEITPRTGRSHQIRVQLAAAHAPILGDVKYGSKTAWPDGIALHAQSISFDHPTRHELVTISASRPGSWNQLGSG